MKIAILTASLSRLGGGLFDAVRRLATSLAVDGPAQVEVLGIEDAHTKADRDLWQPLEPRPFQIRGPRAFGYAPAMPTYLETLGPDLLHTNGSWAYPSLACLGWSCRHGRPHIVSPHGMLDPWALRNSRWKKVVAGWLYENAHLRRAACLHALCPAEAQAMRAYGLRNPICVIPNGMDLPPAQSAGLPPWQECWGNDCRVLLFLGRLHPKKGLPQLLEAWKHARALRSDSSSAWRLAVVGWDQAGHAEVLLNIIRAASLEEEVRLFGPAYGPAKDAALRSASAFVLPSFSEGLPMAVLEAWAYGLPVLMTRYCNLPEGVAAGAALEAEPTPEDLARGLAELFDLSDGQRQESGARGRRLVEQRFAWPTVAAGMRSVYEWALGGGPPPTCVQRD